MPDIFYYINPLFIYIFILLLGLAMGSFLNSWIWRAHENIRIVSGRSICPGCRRRLVWYENIPVFSYLFLGGRCRTCRVKIPPHFFWVELGTALLFVFNAWYHLSNRVTEPLCFLSHIIFTVFLVVIFITDLLYSEIPMDVVIAGIVIGLFFGWRMEDLTLLSMLIGAAVAGGFFLAQYLFSRGKWIGSGDIFLGLMMGIWLGWPNTLIALLIAYVLGSLGGLFLLAVKKRKLNSATPFGTYLALGTFAASFWGPEIMNWYLNLFK